MCLSAYECVCVCVCVCVICAKVYILELFEHLNFYKHAFIIL